MRFLEYGDRNNERVMFIHGAAVPWQMWQPEIDYFADRYQVIIPILDGHDPLDKSIFISAEQAAAEIEAYCMEKGYNKMLAVCGMSMGGIIAGCLIKNQRIKMQKVIMECAPLIPANRFIQYVWKKTNLSQLQQVKQKKQGIVSYYKSIYPEAL